MSFCALVLISYVGWIDPCLIERVRPYRAVGSGTERCAIYQPNNVSDTVLSINECNDLAKKFNQLRRMERDRWE